MTEKQQKRFYFPAWRECAMANDWVMSKGRLLSGATKPDGKHDPEYDGLLAAVWTAAEQLARQQHRGVTADDLRHGCHVVALGTDKSSSDLTNKEVNRVVSLFRLLRDPEDIDARVNWSHPEHVERESFIAYLKKQAPEAAIIAISKNAYGTIFWEDLEFQKLRWICKQVKDRQRSWSRRHANVKPENCPF